MKAFRECNKPDGVRVHQTIHKRVDPWRSDSKSRHKLRLRHGILGYYQLIQARYCELAGKAKGHGAASLERGRGIDLGSFNHLARLPLTERERQVLRLALEGKTDKQTAVELGITEATIKTFWTKIRKRLGANNRAHAVALAHNLLRETGLQCAAKHLAESQLALCICVQLEKSSSAIKRLERFSGIARNRLRRCIGQS